MPTDTVREQGARSSSALRRLLWDGVLPEALGLCFVGIIFIGFAAAYITTSRLWKQQATATRQADADVLAQALAASLSVAAGDETARGEKLAKDFAQLPRMRAVRWTGSDGKVRFVWPPSAESVESLPPAPPPDGRAVSVASAAVRDEAGNAAGTIRVVTDAAAGGRQPPALLWSWGIAAAVTLLVFVVVYHRLRRHLRPVAAIERNLQVYAAGIEKELTALALSDSLGGVARSWNLLIEQIAEWQRQSQQVRDAGQVQDVLTRFESAAFRRVVDRLPFGVLCVGPDQHIHYANSSATSLLARAPETLIGAAISEAIDNSAVGQAVLGLQRRGGAGSSIDHTQREGDHETTLRFRIVPMVPDQAGGAGALVTIEDIGQLKEDQRARDNFLYHVTHELRTPLTSIHAYAETLTKPGFDDEQTRKECYNVIISETRRLSSLVENILSVSQLEVGTARLDVGEIDLVRLLRQMVQDNLGAADEKHIDLTLTLPPKMPKIRGDKQRLAVLLTNLIGNAVKYTPEQGQVRVSAEVGETGLRIAVADNGIGIAPQDQPHVFDKFYRATDDAVQMVTGTGLGLAIAREVARLHGGEIELKSEKGKGSTFTVVLPMPAAEAAEAAVR